VTESPPRVSASLYARAFALLLIAGAVCAGTGET
jgi:hypothetical protein